MLDLGVESGVNGDAVDVLVEIIRVFGPMLKDAEKQALQKTILQILDDDRTGSIVKKKAVVAMSLLSIHMGDALLKSFVSQLAESFQAPELDSNKRRLLLSMAGSLSRSVPQRLEPFLGHLIPFVLNALSEEEYDQAMAARAEDGEADPDLDEVREAALVALEGFLSCCSNGMRFFTDGALDSALRYIVYDPNMAEDEEDEGKAEDEDEDAFEEEEEEEDFEQEGAFSDDEDSSWKLRRCAAKALYAIISTRSNGDLLENGTLYDKIAPVLIKRFKEHEENVRLEILTTLALLVRKTGEGSTLGTANMFDTDLDSAQARPSRKRRRIDSNTADLGSALAFSSSLGLNSPAASPSPVSGPRADLSRLSPSILKGVSELLKLPSVPTKQTAISLLREVVLVQHGGLSDSLNRILEPLVDVIQNTSNLPNGSASTAVAGAAAATGGIMRVGALQLLAAICDTHSSRILAPYIKRIVSSVTAAANDQYYKLSGEALLTIESITKAITPPRSAGTEQERTEFLANIYDVVFTKAKSAEADLELRQRAIHALGVLLARTSGAKNVKLLAKDKRSHSLEVLEDRLRNETTRLSAVKAIEIVFVSAVDQQDLPSPWTKDVALELGNQLRKADRNLRTSSLAALRSLAYSKVALAKLDQKAVELVAQLLLPLITSRDLSLLGVAMSIYSKLVIAFPKQIVEAQLVKALCEVVLSPMGSKAFDAFLNLTQSIGEQGAGQPLMAAFLQEVGVSGDPAVVGKAIGTLLVSGGPSVGVTLSDFEGELRSSKDYQRQCLALSTMGEAGFRLGMSSPLKPETFSGHFSSTPEAVPRTAAIALGRAGAGSIKAYLPVILSFTGKAGNLQYLSLYSIKEILQNAGGSRSDISPYTQQIWENLLAASQIEDNKALAAECIGRITIIEPTKFLPLLQVCLCLQFLFDSL